MSSPKVSIILVNWNNLTDTIDCLESLKKATYQNYEIVLVDNASYGDDVKVLNDRYGDYIKVIENDRNCGFAEGCNIGMRDALDRGADFLVLLNNDTIVAPDFLDEIVKAVQNHENIGIAGGKVYCHETPDMIWFAGGVIDYRTGDTPLIGSGEIDEGHFEEIREVDWICGCYMLISREAIQDVGMLDKRFFFGWEDTDICVRASKKGYKILFVPGSKIWHKTLPPEKLERLTGLPVYYASRGRCIFLEKHFTKRQLAIVVLRFIIKFPRYFWDYSRILGKWNVPIYVLAGILGYLKRKPREWIT